MSTDPWDVTPIDETPERDAFIEGLRQLGDWLDAHPEIPLPWTGTSYDPFSLGVWVSKDELATIARALPGTATKDFRDTTVHVRATFGALHVDAYAGRNEVCERIVTGTETVTLPAVEAKPERVEEREIVEWRCMPLLASEEVTS